MTVLRSLVYAVSVLTSLVEHLVKKIQDVRLNVQQLSGVVAFPNADESGTLSMLWELFLLDSPFQLG